jgi:hypothetical protein
LRKAVPSCKSDRVADESLHEPLFFNSLLEELPGPFVVFLAIACTGTFATNH